VVGARIKTSTKGKLMNTNEKIYWVTDLTTLWEDAFGPYSVHSLVGALFAHAPQEAIERLAQQARDEIRRQTLEELMKEGDK
jgi:hypothetical protein